MVWQLPDQENQEGQEVTQGIIIWPRHIRGSRQCHKNARLWFAQRGWSWAEFVEKGRPIQDLIDTGCPLAARVVAFAEQEATDDGC